ncbi:MAG: c-type cytochrome [Deltaproteobacteria bacterium]|nr:c-type cytochrome [Deltaproteobacteria bacterium]
MKRPLLLASASLALWACGGEPEFTQPLKLAGGKEISPATLARGKERYTLYCRACHGDLGDGRGPAGIGMRPPPRNFTEPAFKFGGVAAGELPPDEELVRIVKGGLNGTPMLPWDVPEQDLLDIIQYIKTFNVIWTEDEPGEKVVISDDPWVGKEAQGVERGKIVYHATAQCLKCHPAYATKQEIWDAAVIADGEGSTRAFREGMYYPEVKFAQAYNNNLLPPDFTRHPIKAGSTPKDLFRTIASGIGGTAMPMWKDAIPDEDIWAIAHYVNSLYAIKDKPEAAELRKRMLEQPDWQPPAPPDAPAPDGAAPPPAEPQ